MIEKYLEEEMASDLQTFLREVPYSNATSVYNALGLQLPGNVGMNAASQCNRLAEAQAHIPGEARLHRAFAEGDPSRKGMPGAHTLLVKETERGDYAFDPYFLHQRPFKLKEWTSEVLKSDPYFFPRGVGFSRTRNLLTVRAQDIGGEVGTRVEHTFSMDPTHAVTETGLETADRKELSYLVRFVFADGAAQIEYRYYGDDRTHWMDRKGDRELKLDGRRGVFLRAQLDKKLAEFNLDVATVTDFLTKTPALKEELIRSRRFKF